MTLYEIDAAIMAMADPETGEVTDFGQLDDLLMERETKVENVALWYKNELAEAEAIKAEAAALTDRAKHHQRKAESLKSYLEYALGESGFETPRVKISRRKATSVEVDEGFVPWALENNTRLLRAKYEPDKAAIKEALKTKDLPGARMVTKVGMVIK